MKVSRQINEQQAMLWNGTAACAWIEAQTLLDGILEPFENLLVQAVAAKSARRVLDVGCGTGGTTLAIARLPGVSGHCIGVDISEPMIAVARARAARDGSTASFIGADAQTHPFELASFDMIISRFGVMFFEDPVGAFANLRRAATDDAELCVLAWRAHAENPFMTTAERAAAPLLPDIPPREPDAPGQFAFADSGRLARILEEGGWAEIDIQPLDVPCAFPEKELVRYFTQLGPLGRVLHEADEQTRTRIIAKVRAAFEQYLYGSEVRFNAACWKVSARSASSSCARAKRGVQPPSGQKSPLERPHPLASKRGARVMASAHGCAAGRHAAVEELICRRSLLINVPQLTPGSPGFARAAAVARFEPPPA